MLSKIREHPESELENTRELEQQEAEKKSCNYQHNSNSSHNLCIILLALFTNQANTDEKTKYKKTENCYSHE